MSGEVRGFLTPQDREYLRGDRDLEEGSEYNTRRRIRERALQAFRDYGLLFEHLQDQDRERVFYHRDGRRRFESVEPIRDTLAMIFEGVAGPAYLAGDIPRHDLWRDTLFAAVERVGLRNGYNVLGVDFGVEAERVNLDVARRKLEEGDRLTAGEIKVLLDEGEAELQPTD